MGVFHPLVEAFLSDLARAGRSPRTVAGYAADLASFARWFEDAYGRPFDPADLTREDVRAYRAHLLAVRRAAPATVNRRLAALAAFGRWLEGRGLLNANPVREIPRAPEPPRAPKALSPQEIRRLLREAEKEGNPLHIAVLVLLAHTGLRVGELVRLTLEDVSLSPRGGALRVRGKGEGFREVPLNAEARRALREWLAARPAAADPRLFLGRRGPLTASGAWRIVRQYARRAGVEAHPHMFRHAFATRLLREKGVDIAVVADLLGHRSLESTMVYVRSTAEDRARAVAMLEE